MTYKVSSGTLSLCSLTHTILRPRRRFSEQHQISILTVTSTLTSSDALSCGRVDLGPDWLPPNTRSWQSCNIRLSTKPTHTIGGRLVTVTSSVVRCCCQLDSRLTLHSQQQLCWGPWRLAHCLFLPVCFRLWPECTQEVLGEGAQWLLARHEVYKENVWYRLDHAGQSTKHSDTGCGRNVYQRDREPRSVGVINR